MRYHFNGEEFRACNAMERTCPFGSENHFRADGELTQKELNQKLDRTLGRLWEYQNSHSDAIAQNKEIALERLEKLKKSTTVSGEEALPFINECTEFEKALSEYTSNPSRAEANRDMLIYSPNSKGTKNGPYHNENLKLINETLPPGNFKKDSFHLIADNGKELLILPANNDLLDVVKINKLDRTVSAIEVKTIDGTKYTNGGSQISQRALELNADGSLSVGENADDLPDSLKKWVGEHRTSTLSNNFSRSNPVFRCSNTNDKAKEEAFKRDSWEYFIKHHSRKGLSDLAFYSGKENIDTISFSYGKDGSEESLKKDVEMMMNSDYDIELCIRQNTGSQLMEFNEERDLDRFKNCYQPLLSINRRVYSEEDAVKIKELDTKLIKSEKSLRKAEKDVKKAEAKSKKIYNYIFNGGLNDVGKSLYNNCRGDANAMRREKEKLLAESSRRNESAKSRLLIAKQNLRKEKKEYKQNYPHGVAQDKFHLSELNFTIEDGREKRECVKLRERVNGGRKTAVLSIGEFQAEFPGMSAAKLRKEDPELNINQFKVQTPILTGKIKKK